MREWHRGHAALRRGRASLSGAEYFLTLCTDGRADGLTSREIALRLLAEMKAMDVDETWLVRCAVVMPDHLHLLLVLGDRLSLGKCVARFKAKTGEAMKHASPPICWERDFFDRRIRRDEDRLSLFLYVYLNPFRAGLCTREDRWRFYVCRDEDWSWFKDYLDDDRPLPEWLAIMKAKTIAAAVSK